MKTVVMTGATSGIGRVAADHILEAPDIELWVGARGAPPPGAHALPLDLARLANVHTFAQAVKERLGECPLDVLVLNAATQTPNDRGRTEDSFETTFAVNHLAHYLLIARALSRSPAAKAKHLRVIAYNPGFTLGTGLQQKAPLAYRWLMAPNTRSNSWRSIQWRERVSRAWRITRESSPELRPPRLIRIHWKGTSDDIATDACELSPARLVGSSRLAALPRHDDLR